MWFFPHDFYGTVKCKWMDEFLCPSPKSDFYKAYLNNFNNPRAFSQFCLIPTILSNISRRKKSNLKIAFTWCMQKHAKIYISKKLNKLQTNWIGTNVKWRVAYHPAKPQAGLTSCAQGDICWGDVWRGLQGLDLSGRLTWRTCAHDVYLTHSEPATKEAR